MIQVGDKVRLITNDVRNLTVVKIWNDSACAEVVTPHGKRYIYSIRRLTTVKA